MLLRGMHPKGFDQQMEGMQSDAKRHKPCIILDRSQHQGDSRAAGAYHLQTESIQFFEIGVVISSPSATIKPCRQMITIIS